MAFPNGFCHRSLAFVRQKAEFRHIANLPPQNAKPVNPKSDPTPSIPIPLLTIGLLIASNVFMTFAWYSHLNDKSSPIWIMISISWGIAFFEYMLQVPANCLGHGYFSAAELKTIQGVITLSVLAVFLLFYLTESLT